QALATAAKPSAGPAGDPNVAIAFALGWQIAELYRPDPPGVASAAAGDDPPLPGLGAFSGEARALIGLAQVDVALHRLAETITKVQLPVPTTDAARAADGGGAFSAAVVELHESLLSTLIAADFKVGKGYELGRTLADLCRGPQDVRAVVDAFQPLEIAGLRARLTDLTSALPAHTGHGVRGSIDAWVAWARLEGRPEPPNVVDLLRRQGERWRALLSGEKQATDVLEFDHYLSAGEGLMKNVGALARKFLAKAWVGVLVLVALLVGAVVFVVTNPDSTAHAVAGLGGLLAVVGLGWKGVGGSLGKALGQLQQPLWGAELDAAVADAIGLVPGSDAAAAFVPQPRSAAPKPAT
ncbi:MAG TPA: hypothetical protein VFR49_11385, partial [Solirubrobacteraceae bacterium]|nr:hypothetical protein [Solirubrobacteraceae bacterium]